MSPGVQGRKLGTQLQTSPWATMHPRWQRFRFSAVMLRSLRRPKHLRLFLGVPTRHYFRVGDDSGTEADCESIAYMETVWLLWFEQEQQGADDTELLIGVYQTEADAFAAKDRLKNQPGFREYPDGFTTSEYQIGQDHWTEGFVRA